MADAHRPDSWLNHCSAAIEARFAREIIEMGLRGGFEPRGGYIRPLLEKTYDETAVNRITFLVENRFKTVRALELGFKIVGEDGEGRFIWQHPTGGPLL
jgi:hypothetical protein